MFELSRARREFGAHQEDILFFDEPRPQLLAYSTLMDARKQPGSVLKPLAGVYEWQGSALLFTLFP